MTPEEISLERSRRLRSAFLDQEFGGAKALLDDNAFGGVIEDKESFLASSAVAGWAGTALGRRVNPASPEWQGVKDGIARGYFKNQAASNVSDNDMFGMIATDYQAQDKVANAARMAAARGESWLGKFRELEVKESGNMIPGRMTNYIGLARAAHDEMAAKVAPYRSTIKTVTEMARNIDTAPEGMDWGAMAAELIKVPKENRLYVLEAISNQAAGSDLGDASSVQRLAKEFDRYLGNYLDSAASSVLGVAMSDIEASAANNPFLTDTQSGEVVAASSTLGDYMDLRDDVREISIGNLAKLKAVEFAGMNISGAVQNIPMTIGSFVPYVGAAVTLGSFQRSTYNEIRRSNPTMSRDDANEIATISAPIQAITEIASDRFLFGKLPNLKRAFTQPIFSTTGALAMFTARAAIGTATEVGEEFAQGVTPLAVQSISKALSKDLPGSDWNVFFSDFAEKVPDLISTILPLAIVGAGTGQLSDFRAGRQMARSTDMLIAAQYSPESAARISELANAGKWGEAENAMRIDWAKINTKGANVSQVKATAQQRLQASERLKALQKEQVNASELLTTSPDYTASVTRTPTGWQVTTGEGTIIPVESAEAARQIAVDLRQVGSQQEADALVSVIDGYYATGKQAETVFTGEDVKGGNAGVFGVRRDTSGAVIATRAFNAKAVETLRAEAEVAGIKSDTREIFAHVNGSNDVFPMRVADGAKGVTRIINLYKSQAESQPQVITFLHENIESTWRLGMANGTFSEQETRTAFNALLPAFDGIQTTDAQELQFIDNVRTLASGKGNDTMLRETVSEMVVRDVLGRDRQGRATGMKPGSISRAIEASVMGANTQEQVSALKSILAAIKAFTAYLKAVFGTVDAISKARDEGKIGEDWDAFVNKVLGIDEVKQMEMHAVKEAREIMDAGNMPFSISATNPIKMSDDDRVAFSIIGYHGGWLSSGGRLEKVQQTYGHADVIESILTDVKIKTPDDYEKAYSKGWARLTRANDAIYVTYGDHTLNRSQIAVLERIGLATDRKVILDHPIKKHVIYKPYQPDIQTFSISPITPAQDAEYLAAVESGDMAKAQAMVDEAAKMAGYNVGPVWHGGTSANEFSTLRPEFIGGEMNSFLGSFFAEKRESAERFAVGDVARARGEKGVNRSFYLKAQNPVSFKHGSNPGSDSEKAIKEAGFQSVKWTAKQLERIQKQTHKTYGKDVDIKDRPDLAASSAMALGLLTKREAGLAFRAKIEQDGIDSVFIENDGNLGPVWIVPEPSQIKSADPVTRDESGEVIPLSQRFNEATPDIRFSISPVTPEQDTKYLAAVEARDMTKAQAMVNEAAKAARLKKAWRKGSVTKKGEGGFHFGTKEQADSIEDNNQKSNAYFINVSNPVRLIDYSDWSDSGLETQGYDLDENAPIVYLNRHEGIGDEGAVDFDGNPLLPQDQDSLSDEEFLDANPSARDSFIIRESNQIKSADPVTRDESGEVIPLSQRFNEATPDIRFSISPVTPEQDTKYLAAVEARDMTKAQAMVDEAARAAGYDVGPVYHGTAPSSWKWDDGLKLFGVFGRDWTAFNGPAYFAANKTYADAFASHRSGERSLGNDPITLSVMLSGKFKDMRSIEGFWKKLRNNPKTLIESASSEGFTGFLLTEADTSKRPEWAGDIYFVFDPNQIKSADPVTRDESGAVIPLSQRFNEASPDIRFSISVPTSDIDTIPEDLARAEADMKAGGKEWASKVDLSQPVGVYRGEDGRLKLFDGHHRWLAARERGEPLQVRESVFGRAVPIGEAPVVARMADGAQLVGPATFSITAYHGTPHKVDKFTTDKIGTGEGAQAYGWGLYFAESRAVGEMYRDKLAQWTLLTSDGAIYDDRKELKNLNVRAVLNKNGSIDEAIARAKSIIESIPNTQGAELALTDIATLEKLKASGGLTKTKGNLYTVELLPDEADFLDWDKPLSEQSEKVKLALKSSGIESDSGVSVYSIDKGGLPQWIVDDGRQMLRFSSERAAREEAKTISKTGASVYQNIKALTDQDKSAALAKAGIPGIRYLDGGSRGAGEGTSNYVIFDESLVKIIEENGQKVESPTFSISPITPAQDAEYLAAVESGDMAKAQAMVDEAARDAGYNVGPVYHGTRRKFNEFVPMQPRGAIGNKPGIYFSPDFETAQEFANDDDGVTDERSRVITAYIRNAESKISKLYGTTEYRIDNPNDAKSADPVTRDESGKVIPLSQRFNEASPDIRFSISPIRNLNELSDQVERQFAENPVAALEVKSKMIRQFAKYADKWSNERWTPKGDKIRPISEKRTVKSLDKEQAMRQARALDEILANQGFTSADAMKSKDAKDYEAWQRLQESKYLLLSGGMTEAEAERLAGASSSTWRKNFVNAIRKAVKQAKAEAQAWRDEADAMQKEDWSPKESLVRDLITLEAIVAMFPQEIRGKIGGFVTLARKASESARLKVLQKQLERGQVLLEKHLKEQYGEATDKLLKRYQSQKDASGRITGKIISTATEQVDYAAEFIKLSVEEQADKEAALEKKIETSDTAEEVQDALTKLGIARLFEVWDTKDSASRESAFNWLADTIEQGKLGKKILDEERKAFLTDMRQFAQSSILQGDKLSPGVADNITNLDKGVMKRALLGMRGVLSSSLWTTLQRLELIFGEDSKTLNYFAERIINAANLSTDIKRLVEAQKKEALSIIFNSDSKYAHARGIAELQKVKQSGITTRKVTKDEIRLDLETLTKLNDGTMTAEAAGLRQDEMDAALEEFANNGRKSTVTIERVTDAGTPVERMMSETQGIQWWLWSMQDASRKQMERDGWDADSLAQLEKFLSREAKALGRWISSSYQDAAGMIDPIYRKLFNAPLPRTKNYSPIHRRNMNTGGDVMDIEGSDMNSGLAAGFTKARVNTTASLVEMDALAVFLAHWENVSHWVSHAEMMRDMKAVLLDKDTAVAIRQKKSEGYLQRLKEDIKTIESNGTSTARELVDISRMWRWFMQFRAYKGLAFRISPIIKQTPAMLNPLIADVPAHNYMMGMARAFMEPKAFASEVSAMWSSDIIGRRIESGFSAESRVAMQGTSMTGSQAILAMQTGMMPMQIVDGGWTALGAAISFDYYRRSYMRDNPQMTPEIADSKAIARVEKMIATSAQPSDIYARALFERSGNPFMRSMSMFVSDQRKTLAIELMAIRRLATGKSKNKALDIQRAIVAHVVMASVSQVMAGVIASLLGDDEDRDREWSVEQWTLALALGPVNGLFAFGRLIDRAGRFFINSDFYQENFGTGQKLGMFPNDNLADKAFVDIYKAGKNMDDLFDPENPDDFMAEIDNLSAAVGAGLSAAIGPAGGAVDVGANLVREGLKVVKRVSD